LRIVTRSSLSGNLLFGLLTLFGAGTASSQQQQPVALSVTAGPMVGHVWDSGAKIWVQLDRPAAVSVDVRPRGQAEWQPVRWKNGGNRYERIWEDTRLAGTLMVEGLQPGTLYEYRLRERDTPVAATGEQSFRTAVAPGRRASRRISCWRSARAPATGARIPPSRSGRRSTRRGRTSSCSWATTSITTARSRNGRIPR
jgi:hypothetical protein